MSDQGIVNVGARTAVERRVLAELSKLEKQPHPPTGEANGEWRCNCGETVTWTRDAIRVPSGVSAQKYAAQEQAAFLLAVNAEIQKHQLTHARSA